MSGSELTVGEAVSAAKFVLRLIRESKAAQHKRCVDAVMGFVQQAKLGREIECALRDTLKAVEEHHDAE